MKSGREKCSFDRSPTKVDGLVKSRKISLFVIPVKTGIQLYHMDTAVWTPVFTGVTTFYEAVKVHRSGLQTDFCFLTFER